MLRDAWYMLHAARSSCCHVRPTDAVRYEIANQLFADAVLAEHADGDSVWVCNGTVDSLFQRTRARHAEKRVPLSCAAARPFGPLRHSDGGAAGARAAPRTLRVPRCAPCVAAAVRQ